MGAWGPGPFDNDDAADFVDGLDGLNGDERRVALHEALAAAAEEAGYLDADPASCAVAAAALVAGGEHGDLGELAERALVRVLGDDSELAALWASETGDDPWTAEIAKLRQALSS
jgi:hypothetical protein